MSGGQLTLAMVIVVLATLAVAAFYWGQAGTRPPNRGPEVVPGGDAERGRVALQEYGCGACHVIDGLPDARGRVGPALDADLRRRTYVAGSLPNTPDNLVRWIVDPTALRPDTPMPTLGVTPAEARDMAAYLLSRGGRP